MAVACLALAQSAAAMGARLVTKRARRNGNGFNIATVAQIFAIPVLTVGIYFVGNYFIAGDTLKRHEVEIASEAAARKASEKEQTEQRQKLSDSLLTYAQKTQEGISALTTHAAVQDEQIKNVTSTLDHVVSGLQSIERAISPPPPGTKR